MSVAEQVYNGPLDISRRLDADAIAIDELAWDCLDEKSAEHRALASELSRLDALHPYFGHEVVVYGSVMGPAIDESGNMCDITIGNGSDKVETVGIYAGYALRPARDLSVGRVVNRATHVVHTGVANTVDGKYQIDSRYLYEHILVDGAEVTPVLPVDAHSLEDCAKDGVVGEIDSLAYAIEDRRERVVRIGELMNKVFARNPGALLQNHQRTSYINSLGLLDGLKLTTQEVLVAASREAFEHGSIEMVGRLQSSSLVATSTIFEAMLGYEIRGDGAVIISDKPELYASSELPDGNKVFVAAKRIRDIKPA